MSKPAAQTRLPKLPKANPSLNSARGPTVEQVQPEGMQKISLDFRGSPAGKSAISPREVIFTAV